MAAGLGLMARALLNSMAMTLKSITGIQAVQSGDVAGVLDALKIATRSAINRTGGQTWLRKRKCSQDRGSPRT